MDRIQDTLKKRNKAALMILITLIRAIFLKTLYRIHPWRVLSKCVHMSIFVFSSLLGAIHAIDIEMWQTQEGLNVYYVFAPELPIVDIQLDFKSGSAANPKDKIGLASLAQSQLLLGNEQWHEEKVASHLADFGAELGGSVQDDHTSFRLRMLNNPVIVKEVFRLWINLLEKPSVNNKILQREKKRRIAHYRESLTDPKTIARRTFYPAVFGDHPYGYQESDTSYLAIQVEDIHQFYRQHYRSDNANLVVVGAISQKEVQHLAGRLASSLLPRSISALPSTRLTQPAMPIPRRIDIPFDSQQTHILLGLPFIDRQDPDFFPLLVGTHILGGGGFESRLMKEIRVKNGLAYSVYSTFSAQMQRGAWYVGLQTRHTETEKALSLLEKTIDLFLKEGVTKSELTIAKQFLMGSFPLRLDNNRKMLGLVAMIGYYNLPLDYLDTWKDKVQSVTANDIRQAFSRHLKTGQWVTVTVGP